MIGDYGIMHTEHAMQRSYPFSDITQDEPGVPTRISIKLGDLPDGSGPGRGWTRCPKRSVDRLWPTT